MSTVSLSVGHPGIAQRRRAAWRVLVAGARHTAPAVPPGALCGPRVFADAAWQTGDKERVAVRPAVCGALAVALLHAVLIAAWLHARPARQELPITPPIALQMTAAPQPSPQAPAPALKPLTPPKALSQARHAPKPRHAPTPTSPPAPSSQTPLPAVAPSVAPGESAVPAAAAPAAPTVAPSVAPAQKTTLPDGGADYLHNPAPEYPATAQDYGWQGKVLLHVHVRADGSPDTVQVRTSSGHRVLDDAAVAAVRHWSFVPAKRGDTPVDGWVDVPLNFQLD